MRSKRQLAIRHLAAPAGGGRGGPAFSSLSEIVYNELKK